MELHDDQLELFSPGKIFRFPGFTLASSTGFSYYPMEDQWLFVPYSVFKVKRFKDQVITLGAMDNVDDADSSTTTDDDSQDADSTDNDE
ncbi:unnamed protein product [Rotaria magnacalcarata]|uniref:Mono(ADP-ribosyl)transferase n=1 Tax=Rotaria magnacalcarata TaxID=392030 RepID=A0A817A686_9BILA|nr:unnamed protein product [Rotaria magnacalcarata]